MNSGLKLILKDNFWRPKFKFMELSETKFSKFGGKEVVEGCTVDLNFAISEVRSGGG